MKVVILSSSDSSGGAAIASYRLHQALLKSGIDSNMLVRHKRKTDNTIQAINQYNYYTDKEVHPRFAIEKMLFVPYEKSKKERFTFSTNQFGFEVSKHPLVQNADIIHLHWINNSYISLSGLTKLLSLNKPVVWTLHDMWPFTGGCHYSGDCLNYQSKCNYCPQIKNPSANDLSARIFEKKEAIYKNKDITAISCSKWLAEIANNSSLFKNFNITDIANPIDQTVFYPFDKLKARRELNLKEGKIYLLFAAGNIFDERKGIRYLIEALEILSLSNDIVNNLELLVMGKADHNFEKYFSIPVNYLGQVSGNENLCRIFNAADAFLLPSQQDNLPNTIMESLACGTPVIAFKTGGIPEMVEHKTTGYLAEEKSPSSLADGINWLVKFNNKGIQKTCIDFVTNNYSEKLISEKYIQVYKKLLGYGK